MSFSLSWTQHEASNTSVALCAAPTLEQIYRLEDEIAKLPAADCPVREYFVNGLYAREMTLGKGTVATGAIHKSQHLCVISAGEITVWIDGLMKRLKAPCTFVAEPKTKRVVYVHEDTVFTTFHATQETNPEKLVSSLCESTKDELLGGARNKHVLNQLKQGEQACLSE